MDSSECIDIVLSMYNLIEYSDNYSKASRSLWQYCKEIPAINNRAVVDFNGPNATDSFNFKSKIICTTDDDGGIIRIISTKCKFKSFN